MPRTKATEPSEPVPIGPAIKSYKVGDRVHVACVSASGPIDSDADIIEFCMSNHQFIRVQFETSQHKLSIHASEITGGPTGVFHLPAKYPKHAR